MRVRAWSRLAWLVGAGAVAVVASNRLFVLVLRDRHPRALRRLRRWFARINPLVVRMAERFDVGQPVLYHVGRRSGVEHATPLCVTEIPGAFIVPAAFGPEVDWLANLRTTPRARLRCRGRVHAVDAEVVDAVEARRVAGDAPHCGCWDEYRVETFAVLRPVATGLVSGHAAPEASIAP